MKIWFVEWASVHTLIYLPLVLVGVGLLWYRLVRVKKMVALLSASHHLSRAFSHFSWRREVLKCILSTVGLVFLFLALLRPQWGTKEQVAEQQARDLFIALDISRSMLATDCKPNRLACAKKKIKELVHNLSAERVGLILFSGSSFIQCPLTSDYAAFDLFLDQVDVETISSGSTALDQAITQALVAFKTTPQRKNKLLAIFTDGEDFSTHLSAAQNLAHTAGLHIATFGVGTHEGAPIPLVDMTGKSQGHQKDKKGTVVISRLNESLLQEVARSSQGTYVRMTHDAHDIEALESWLQEYEKEKLDDVHISLQEEQYPYFLAVSFFSFLLEWVL